MKCYRCGGEMNIYEDWKPHSYVSGECLECGFSYHTVETQLTLQEVNELREYQELEPLKELKIGE